jgi:hypothetical protein
LKIFRFLAIQIIRDTFLDHFTPSLAWTSLICEKNLKPNNFLFDFILKRDRGSGQNWKILFLNSGKNVTWHFWKQHLHLVSFGDTISNPPPPRVPIIIKLTPKESQKIFDNLHRTLFITKPLYYRHKSVNPLLRLRNWRYLWTNSFWN